MVRRSHCCAPSRVAMTVSIPLAAVVQPTHLGVDVTISWRASPSSAAAAVSHGERHGGGKAGATIGGHAAPSDHPRPHRWKALFESALLTHSAEAALPTEHLPPTLSRSLSLYRCAAWEPHFARFAEVACDAAWAPFAPHGLSRHAGQQRRQWGGAAPSRRAAHLKNLARSRWGASAGAAQVSR